MNFKYYLNMVALAFSKASRKVKCMFVFLISGMLTYIPLYSTTLWDKASSSSTEITTAIENTYNSLWWVAFLLTFIPWIFVKNEKLKTALKVVWIGVLVGFVVLRLKTPIEESLKTGAGWFGGSST